METAFTRLMGCAIPIQQAGMGGTATPELAAAVTGAGALGMLGAAGLPPGELSTALRSLRQAVTGPFGVNFLMPFLDRAALEVAATGCALVEFFYGSPDPLLIELVHAGGTLVAWQTGSRDEARMAADSGCDLVVVQGSEAGGHVRGEVALLPLLDLVLDAVDVPVVAAGGVGSPRSVAAVLAAGASAARVGTRFLAAPEADVHPAYAAAVLRAEAEDTELTTAFSNLWPDAPHRVLRASIEAAARMEGEIVGELELAGRRIPVPRWSPPSPGRGHTGHVEAMAHYAGQSVGQVRRRQPAAEIVTELMEGMERLLRDISTKL